MNNTFDSLIDQIKTEDAAVKLTGLEARIWQKLEAARLKPGMLFAMQALQALPVVMALVLGGAAGASAMASYDDFAAFSAMPAYSVARLVQ